MKACDDIDVYFAVAPTLYTIRGILRTLADHRKSHQGDVHSALLILCESANRAITVEPTSRSGVRASDDYPGGMRYQTSDDSTDEIPRNDFQRVTNCAKRNVLSLDGELHLDTYMLTSGKPCKGGFPR